MLDKDGQPICKALHYRKNQLKALNMFYGLCMGIAADQIINDSEISLLRVWLDNHPFVNSFRINLIRKQIDRLSDNGQLHENQRKDLLTLINTVIGDMFLYGMAGGLTTKLALDKSNEDIIFRDRSFCLTGKFSFGPRKLCQYAIIDAGGLVKKTVSRKLDYLIVGSLSSRD